MDFEQSKGSSHPRPVAKQMHKKRRIPFRWDSSSSRFPLLEGHKIHRPAKVLDAYLKKPGSHADSILLLVNYMTTQKQCSPSSIPDPWQKAGRSSSTSFNFNYKYEI
ncbi:hypothetical protein IM774_02845 [Erysipelotrichaceae bacterium RD49]|nr:hypothetical protein [Erysipelotrichaceae bacterium RD49]